ncbi:MAG: InlB B-repeat-containing protein [Clostridia bacterium]
MKKLVSVMVLVFLTTMLFAQYVAPVSVNAAPGALVYEGFDYTPQAVHGLNGGIGFGSAWDVQNIVGSRLGLSITDNSPLTYSAGGKFLTTSGRDLGLGTAYLSTGRLLDMSSNGVLKDFVVYNPTPLPSATPIAGNGLVGKVGTKIWGSYLHNFGMPAGLDGDNRAFTLSTGVSTSQSLTGSNQKVSIGYFGTNSRLTPTGTSAYWTLRIYSATNPGAYSETNTADKYFYDVANKFMYIRMTDKVISLTPTTSFISYSVDYTAIDATVNVYINPALGATEPATADATFTMPIASNNMNFRSLFFNTPNNIYKMYLDEIRLGSSFETVNPNSVAEPQPILSPSPLGPKITWASGTATPQPGTVVTGANASNGQYLVDGIINDNTKCASLNNASFAAYYTISLPSTMMVAGVKLYLGETGATLGKQTPLSFYLTYYNGSSWDIIPGTNVWSNRMAERTIVFPKPLRTFKIRLVNITLSDTKIREMELFEPATNAGFTQTVATLGAASWNDEFGYLDNSLWDIVGATPSSLETPPAWASPNPTPAAIYAPQIVDDSAVTPLDWTRLSIGTPLPTTAPTYRADYYAQDGKGLLLTPTTNYYAFRSKTAMPANYIIDATFKCGRGASPVYIYFNESGTTATGTATNGYRLDVTNNDSSFNTALELKKMVNGTAYYLANGAANVRPFYYETLRIQVKDGNIKVYQYDPETGMLQLIDVNDVTYTSGNIMLSRLGTTFTKSAVFDSVRVFNIAETTTDYSPHNVTFKDWDNTTVLKTESVGYAKSATAPTTPPRTGYTFTGWDVDFSNVTTDLTVVAVYAINHYTVSFKDWNGGYLKTQSVAYLDSATAPSDPARVGHTFTGWDVGFTSIASDTIVTAQYSINSYLVTFYNWDDTPIGVAQSVPFGSSAIAPADPTKPNYTFTGWDVSFKNITTVLNVKATFAINTYTVTFKNWDNSTIGSPQTIAHGAAAIAPAEPTKVGSKFMNWDVPFNNITGDLVVTAVFSLNSYTVTFKNWDGSLIGTPQAVSYGASAVAPAIPVRVGYTFTGWDTTFDNITGDLTVGALFQANPVPMTPTINVVTNGARDLSGKAVSGGVVTIMVGSKKYTITAVASAWKITMPKAVPAGTKITVSVLKDGVKSLTKTIYVIPMTPTVYAVKANAVVVKGVATKGAIVYAKIGTKSYSSKANAKTGIFAIKVPKAKKNVAISVRCKAGGQYSASKTIKVK